MKVKRVINNNFFKIYFVAIILILIFLLLNSKTLNYEKYQLGTDASQKYEILDGNIIEADLQIIKASPKGITINGYLQNGIEFTDEKLYICFYDAVTNEILQNNEILLKNEADERNIYVAFERELAAGTNLKICIWSEGLTEKGPKIAFSNSAEIGNLLKVSGELSAKYLCATLYYEKIEYNYVKPLLYFVAEILIGFVLLYIYKKHNIPIFENKKRNTSLVYEFKKQNLCKTLIKLFCFFALSFVFLDFVYTMTVEQIIDKREVGINLGEKQENNAIAENSNGEYFIYLHDGDELSQCFYVEKENLSGVGLKIGKGATTAATLRCKLYDMYTGEELLEKVYNISKQKAVFDYLASDTDNEIVVSVRDYIGIDFQQVMKSSQNGYYKLVLKLEDAGKNVVSIATENNGDDYPVSVNGESFLGNIKIISLHSNNIFLKTMFWSMAIIITVFLGITYVYMSVHGITVANLYLVSAIVFGLIFCVLIPPYCVPDERAHIESAYRISNKLMGIEESAGPNRSYRRSCDIDLAKENTMDVTLERYKEVYDSICGLTVEDDVAQLGIVYTDNAVSNVTMLNYLPVAIGFSVARILDFNHIAMVLLGRLLNLLAITLIMYWAIKKVPFGKSLFAVIGLLPMTLQQAASCSYDGMIVGMAYVFIAYCFALLYKKSENIWNIAVMIYSGAFLAACKGGVYLPILGLILLFVIKKQIKIKEVIETIAIYVSLAFIFLAQFSTRILSMFARAEGTTSYRAGATESEVELYTFSYLIRNIKKMIRLFQNTFSSRGDAYIQELLGGKLGKLNVYIPWFVLIGFLVLLFMCALKRSDEKTYMNKLSKVYIGILCFASILLVMLSMLIAWTKFGAVYIEGVQGRYFLPFVGLLLILLRNDVLVYNNKNSAKLVWMAGVLDLLVFGYVMISVF